MPTPSEIPKSLQSAYICYYETYVYANAPLVCSRNGSRVCVRMKSIIYMLRIWAYMTYLKPRIHVSHTL